MERLNELALFAGAGGGLLGSILNGWRTVCAVEIDDYCRRALMQRQLDGHLEPFPIWDDVTTFDGRPWRGLVDIVTGGFPCQDISVAGPGVGLGGERSGLWGEMRRIIGEVGPRFAFVENSPALLGRGLGTVLGDLSQMGFDAQWGCVSAASQGAPHLRTRVWIVADSHSQRQQGDYDQGRISGETLAPKKSQADALHCVSAWQASYRDILRVDDGLAPGLVRRIAAIGNGQVPAVVRAAWSLLGPSAPSAGAQQKSKENL